MFDGDGNVCAIAQREIRQSYPHPGWVEQDPLLREPAPRQHGPYRTILEYGALAAATVGLVILVGATQRDE